MNISLAILIALLFMVVPALSGLLIPFVPTLQKQLGLWGIISGSTLGFVGCLVGVFYPFVPRFLSFNSHYFLVNFSCMPSDLSLLFLLPLFFLSGSCALYGKSYMQSLSAMRSALQWLLYSLLIASMAILLCVNNALLFLIVWELMSIMSFLLIFSCNEDEKTRLGAWIYLVSMHIGALFLTLLVLSLGNNAGSFSFVQIALHSATLQNTSLLCVFVLCGFGMKAGLFPLHIWLPKAHPVAPAHVSAIMSGIMITMGVFGIMKFLPLCGVIPPWVGFALLVTGCISALFGILSALGQTNIKKILAYSSIENMGLIAIGLGLGYCGYVYDNQLLSTIGFSAALLHIVNHSLIKSMLFLSAGTIVFAYHTNNIEEMGGLLKKTGATGLFFGIGALALAGLPPLNGLFSEVLFVLAAFVGISSHHDFISLPATLTLCTCVFTGGLALVCFARAFGFIFLGETRSTLCDKEFRPEASMIVAMSILLAGCCLMVVSAPFIIPYLSNIVTQLYQNGRTNVPELNYSRLQFIFASITASIFGLLSLFAIVFLIRKKLYKNKSVHNAGTWDCGYSKPTARMQYTATSFTREIVDMCKNILFPNIQKTLITTAFPKQAFANRSLRDAAFVWVYTPLCTFTSWALASLKWIQDGKMHVYILYIAIALVALFMWSFL